MISNEIIFFTIVVLALIGIGLKAFQLFFQKPKVLGVIEIVDGSVHNITLNEEIFPPQFKSYLG